MSINLPPDIQQAVQRHMSTGQFRSAEDVLRAAMIQFDQMDLVSLKLSLDDQKAGRMVTLQSVASSLRNAYGFPEST
jgi:Arc/MetJ-type ribon-helix-helix transcriptional regulator